MNIQQISTDKLRVALDSSDLDRYNLDYFSISRESPGTKRLLREILEKAQKSGFTAIRCKILIEVLPGKDNGCILYLTKTPGPAAARKNRHPAPDSYVLCCDGLEDAIEALGRFKEYPDLPIRSSALYCYQNKYHLVFLPVALGLNRERLVSLLADLSEYGETETASPVRTALLAEHGETILKNRAVEAFIRYFH